MHDVFSFAQFPGAPNHACARGGATIVVESLALAENLSYGGWPFPKKMTPMITFDTKPYPSRPLHRGRVVSCHKARQARDVNPLVRRCAR